MVEQGDLAVVHFVGRIVEGEEAGSVFDTTDVDVAMEEGVYHDHRDYKPLEFRVGEGAVIEGRDRAVREMEIGETRTVELSPEEAFGGYDEARVVEMPRETLEAQSDADAAEGALVRSDSGEVGWITDVSDEAVTVDFNHELAGEPVEFEIRLLDAHSEDDG